MSLRSELQARLWLVSILVGLACLASTQHATARTDTKIHHFWSGTVSLDYTESQDSGWYEHFRGTASIDATSDTYDPYSPSIDPALDNLHSWFLYGDVEGAYNLDMGGGSCVQSGTPNPEFEQPPPGYSVYQYDQAFSIFGPKTFGPGKQYVVNTMQVHLTGQEDCGEGPQPFDRPYAPFPSSDLDYFGVDVHLRLPTSGEGGPVAAPNGGRRWQGSRTYTGTKTDPDTGPFGTITAVWTYDLVYRDEASSCRLTAANPQRPAAAFVVKVRGGPRGCTAKLKTAKLKIGKKVFVFIKRRPSRQVGAGTVWRLEIPLKGQILETVRAALSKGQQVRAKAEFDLDGQTASVISRIR